MPLTENGVVPVTIAGIRLEPGQTADFDVYVVNASTTTVHVVGARLVGLPGHRTPVLVQVAVETGVNSVGSQVGWPPDGVSLGGGDELSLTPGVNRIAVGATPPRHGVFVATGLLLSYGQGRSAVAWGGSVSCAVAHPASGRWCSRHERGLDTRIRAFIRSGGRG